LREWWHTPEFAKKRKWGKKRFTADYREQKHDSLKKWGEKARGKSVALRASLKKGKVIKGPSKDRVAPGKKKNGPIQGNAKNRLPIKPI